MLSSVWKWDKKQSFFLWYSKLCTSDFKTGGLGERSCSLCVDQDIKGLVRESIGILVTEQSGEMILIRTFRVEQKMPTVGLNKYSSKGLLCEECTQ